MDKKKTYKWIVIFCCITIACFTGNYLKEKYDSRVEIEGWTPVDVENITAEELVNSNDEGREEYVFKININTASAEEFAMLDSIGKVTAEKIISYRNDFGSFVKIEEIMNVEGIGEKTFGKIKKHLIIE